MSISVRCSSCQTSYSVGESMAGKTVKCKKCGNAFRIPAPAPSSARPAPRPAAAAPAEADDPLAAMMEMERNSRAVETEPPPPAPSPGGAAPPPFPSMTALPQRPMPAPSLSRGTPISAMRTAPVEPGKKPSGSRFGGFHLGSLNFNRFTLALVIIGGALIVWGGKEALLGTASKATPRQITCAELEAQGPGDNAHVVLTNFMYEPRGTVYAYDKNTNRWNTVWVPAV